jgi:hypothetical protein
MNCQCGCSEGVPNGLFKPGHDQRLRTDLERRVGGIIALRDLVEAAESYTAGQSDTEEFTKSIRAIFTKLALASVRRNVP